MQIIDMKPGMGAGVLKKLGKSGRCCLIRVKTHEIEGVRLPSLFSERGCSCDPEGVICITV